MSIWITAKEAQGLPDMPATDRGCRKTLERLSADNPARFRKRAGSKASEYHISILPLATKAKLLAQQGKIELNGQVFNAPTVKPVGERYDAKALWLTWERAGEKAQATAKQKLGKMRISP